MVDLSPQKVFKFVAFEPSDEELSKHAREMRRGKRRLIGKRNGDVRVKSRSPTPEKTFDERGLDDSDDDLPDVSTMLDVRPKKRARVESDEDEGDVSPFTVALRGAAVQRIFNQDETMDLTLDQVSVPLGDEPVDADDNDDDIEVVKVTLSPQKVNGKAPVTKQRDMKRKRSEDGPSAAVIKTWRRGDDEMEPSAKMVELVELLKGGEAAGDKTIVYSQCESFDRSSVGHGILILRWIRDIDA